MEIDMDKNNNENKINENITENKQMSAANSTEENEPAVKGQDENANAAAENSRRYEKLLDLDVNLWTYGSPVLFESGVLERDTVSNKNRLTLKFTNIYRKDIRDINITVLAADEEENEVEIEHIS